MTLIYIVLASLAIMLVALIGKLTTYQLFGPWVERNLKYLVSFSAGVFAVIAGRLVFEAFELSESALIAGVSIVAGALFIFLVSQATSAHHHHDMSNPEDQHSREGARRILLSDAIHNLGDGFLLAPAFFVSPILGALTTLGILVHEAVQEISEFFVLRQGGYSVRRALTLNFIVASTVLAGALLGYLVAQSEHLLGPLLGVAAGAFLYVVSLDLIPHSFRASRRERGVLRYHLLAAGIGILVFVGINAFVGHEHPHEGEQVRTHDEHPHKMV